MADDLRRELTFRRLREGDRRPILEVFDAMSASSRRARFHGAKPRLTETDVERLAAVGCCGREAVAAIERTSGKAVGIARYVVDDDGVAEVAYEVTDEWQGRGVGRRLIVELARLAHAQGIYRLRGLFEAGNRPALALLDHIGHPAGQDYDAGELELAVTLRA